MKRFIAFAIGCLILLPTTHAALVGYWNFSETSGNVTHNQVAGGPDGTLLGGAHFTTTSGLKDPHCVRLDSLTSDLVDFGNNYNFTGSFSVLVWVKLDPGNTAAMYPLSKYESTTSNSGYFVGLGNVAGGYRNAQADTTQFIEGGLSAGITDSLSDGVWHMLIGQYDASTGDRTIYEPGKGSGGTGGATHTAVSTADFLLGGTALSGIAKNQFSGWIDEVRLYDTLLSESDIENIRLSVLPEPASLLVGTIPLCFLLCRQSRHSKTTSN